MYAEIFITYLHLLYSLCQTSEISESEKTEQVQDSILQPVPLPAPASPEDTGASRGTPESEECSLISEEGGGQRPRSASGTEDAGVLTSNLPEGDDLGERPQVGAYLEEGLAFPTEDCAVASQAENGCVATFQPHWLFKIALLAVHNICYQGWVIGYHIKFEVVM